MPGKKTITLSELRARRGAGDGEPPAERVEVPAAIKWIGAVVVFVTAFFAATLVVLVAYQALGVQASQSARTTGLVAIVVLGLLFFAAGILLLWTQAASASSWLGRQLVKAGIAEDPRARRRTPAGRGRPPRRR